MSERQFPPEGKAIQTKHKGVHHTNLYGCRGKHKSARYIRKELRGVEGKPGGKPRKDRGSGREGSEIQFSKRGAVVYIKGTIGVKNKEIVDYLGKK